MSVGQFISDKTRNLFALGQRELSTFLQTQFLVISLWNCRENALFKRAMTHRAIVMDSISEFKGPAIFPDAHDFTRSTMRNTGQLSIGLRAVLCTVGLLALLIALAANPAMAAKAHPSTAASSPSAGPEIVSVGFYVNDIYELDLKRSTYVVDFYIWLRWKGDVDPTAFEFLNGTLDLKEHPFTEQVNGINYAAFHCRGTFHSIFDFRRYPLDKHELLIVMEDGSHETSQIVYAIDRDNMKAPLPFTISGWTVDQPVFETRSDLYQTNFGDPAEAAGSSSTYAQLHCSIHITRSGDSIYIKTFLGLFIAVSIAFLSFLLKPAESDQRFALGVAAIFAAVSSEVVANSNLPDMPYLTLADKIHLFSLFMIFLSLMQSCLSLRLSRKKQDHIAARIDRASLIAYPITYALVVMLLTVF